jgi:hypothetical protein
MHARTHTHTHTYTHKKKKEEKTTTTNTTKKNPSLNYLSTVFFGELYAFSDGGEAGFALKHLASKNADKTHQLLLSPHHKC